MLLKLLVPRLKTNQLFLQNGNMFFELKILLIQYSLVLLYPFKQRNANTFLSDHDAFFIYRNKIVSLGWRARVAISA